MLNRLRRCLVVVGAMMGVTGCALLVPQRGPVALEPDDRDVVACAAATGLSTAEVAAAQGVGGMLHTDDAHEAYERAAGTPGALDPREIGLNICSGILTAVGYHRSYFRALRWQSGFRNTATATSILLGGLAAREGLQANPSNDRIADLSVTTIVLFGWMQALTSTPRQRVYLNGQKAMACTIQEAQPLMIGASQLRALGEQEERVRRAIAALDAAVAKSPLAGLSGSAGEPYLQAKAEARNAIGRTDAFAVELATAAGALRPMVDALAAEVGHNIVDTEPSDQSLLAIVNGFGAQSRALSDSYIPEPSPPADTDALVTESDNPALADALRTRAALEAETAALNALLSRVVAVAAARGSVAACKPESVRNEFGVRPNDSAIVIEVGATREFTVTNQVAQPTARLEGENADSVELGEIVASGGESFMIRVTGRTATGAAGPVLVIVDGTGQQDKRIAVSVAPAPDEPQPPPPENTGPVNGQDNAAMTDDERQRLLNTPLNEEESDETRTVNNATWAIRCIVGVRVGTTVNTDVRAAIANFRSSPAADGSPAGTIDTAFIEQVRTALEQRPTCRPLQASERAALVEGELVPPVAGADEAAVIEHAVRVLQCIVGIEVDGAVGPDTREAIATFTGEDPPVGVIDAALIGAAKTALATKPECAPPSP